MVDDFESFKNYINNGIPNIPDLITEEWLQSALQNQLFQTWGFSCADLSKKGFSSDINKDTIKRVPFSTQTIFPKDVSFPIDALFFKKDDQLKSLHDTGINGEGINVAVIDYGFKVIPNEIKGSLASYNKYKDTTDHFHGSVVSSILVGKNIGVIPNAKLHFFEIHYDDQVEEIIRSLEDIYELNQKGANIKIVNISAGIHREQDKEKFDEISKKLSEQGCYVIDSYTFGSYFTCINKDNLSGGYYYSTWQQKNGLDNYKSKIAVVSGGRMVPLYGTESDYIYVGESSYSWAIPMLSGYFGMALQINPELTPFDFFKIIYDNRRITEDGITLFDLDNTFKNVMELKENKKDL